MTVNPRQSFKLKLCLWTLSVSLVTFLTISLASLYFSSKEVREGVSKTVLSKLDYAVRALDEGLTCTQVSSDNLLSILNSTLIDIKTDSIYLFCEKFLDANLRTQGVALGFEPGVFLKHPEGFSPYVMRRGDGYIIHDLAKEKDYRSDQWYKGAYDAAAPVWSVPFRESNGTVITSYNVPIMDAGGKIIGVAATDLNLSVVADSLQNLRPYPGSDLSVIDDDGRYVAHADPSFILEKSADPDLLASISAGETYYVEKSGKEDVYFFHATEPKTGWTIILSVPKSSIVQGLVSLNHALLIDMAVGIILLLLVSLVVINRLTKPLETFASAAKEMSHGNFNVDLPVIKDHNELYDLRQALSSMEVSLNEYIARLEETSSKKASIEKELMIARNIQMSMIPKIFPPYPERTNIDIFASLTPAQAVGGDLYDFVLCGDTLFFCIGDVSGKGVPASLLMAITRSLFRNTVSEDKTPAQIASILNNAIAENNEMTMFVTMFISSVNLKSGAVKVCNCGHNPPVTFVGPDGKHSLMTQPPVNIAVGVIGGYRYRDFDMTVQPGTSILLYTDGVTEAENKDHELYSESRMLELLDSLSGSASSKEVVETLVSDVKTFAGMAPQSDDITVLMLKCNFLG